MPNILVNLPICSFRYKISQVYTLRFPYITVNTTMFSTDEIRRIQKQLNGNDKDLAVIFKTLSDVNRCRMFRMFTMVPRMSVSSTAKVMNISVPLACQHLKVLMQAGLVINEKIGRNVFYELKKKNPLVHSVLRVIKQYV